MCGVSKGERIGLTVQWLIGFLVGLGPPGDKDWLNSLMVYWFSGGPRWFQPETQVITRAQDALTEPSSHKIQGPGEGGGYNLTDVKIRGSASIKPSQNMRSSHLDLSVPKIGSSLIEN